MNRYWVYLGDHPESGPFPNYDEADRERQYLLRHKLAWVTGCIFTIRTDEYTRDLPKSMTKKVVH